MQVNVDALSNIQQTLNKTVSVLSVMVNNLNTRKSKIKDEGWNDAHAKSFEEILVSIASTAKEAAIQMADLSKDIGELIKKVDEYQSVSFTED